MILYDPCPNPLKVLWEALKAIIKNKLNHKSNGTV